MESRRREPRFETNQLVTVTNLEQPDVTLKAKLTNFSAKGTRLLLDRELKPGTIVKVEWGTTILLGEIIYCEPGGAPFAAGLELEDVLYETDMLFTLSKTWKEESVGKR